jgi:hypothetical protein
LVTEAGGVLSTLTGGEFHTHVDSMIGQFQFPICCVSKSVRSSGKFLTVCGCAFLSLGASTPELADQLRKILAQE